MAPAPAPLPIPALFPPDEGAPPKWPAPNYISPETHGWAASACIIAMFVVTFGVFCARIWSRFKITRTSAMDDWLIIASMPVLLGQTIATVLGLRIYGFQLHIYDQTPKTYITVRQITLAMETIYLGTTTLTKISILLFYRRMSSSLISLRFTIVVWASIIFVAAYGISFIFTIVFTCWPVEAYWYRFTTSWLDTHSYKCHNELVTLIIVISISTAQDFLACILPMFIVRKLRLPMRQKVGLGAIFGVGLATCALGCSRIWYAWRHWHLISTNDPTFDVTWDSTGAWIATSIEANLAVICASAPALKVYCKCFNTPSQITRSFGWYHGRSNTESSCTGSLRSWWCGFTGGRLSSGCSRMFKSSTSGSASGIGSSDTRSSVRKHFTRSVVRAEEVGMESQTGRRASAFPVQS